MNRSRWALACAAVAAAVSVSALTTLPAKADGPAKTWVSQGSGQCLGVLGGNMTDGTPVVQWPCNGHPDQQWFITTVSATGVPDGQVTTIRNFQDPSMCLDVAERATNDGANLLIWGCDGNSSQNWIFQNVVPVSRGVPFGCWNIENQGAAPRVLGILGASQSDGAQAVIWDKISGHLDQEFC